MDVLLSLASAWSGAPLENEEGGRLLAVLVFGLVEVGLTGFERGLAATEDGPGLAVGGGIVG